MKSVSDNTMQIIFLMCVSFCIADDEMSESQTVTPEESENTTPGESENTTPGEVLNETLRWVDHFPIDDADIYFDRVVAIFYGEEKAVRAPGLLITRYLVLTTYNPFRNEVKQGKENMEKVKIISIRTRTILDGGQNVSYTFQTSTITCGRQVLPTEDQANIWHLGVGEQSPLHDLMVLRLKTPLQIRNKTDSDLYEFDLKSETAQDAGPIVTRLASRRAQLGDDLKFASYGHIDSDHIKTGTELRSHEFAYDDHVQADCEEWLPREWGHFICLNNMENFPAITSGAVLVHKDFVYGLGNFLLERGENKSILVFTDLRPYLNLIYNACSKGEKL